MTESGLQPWWIVARSEEVTSREPLSVDIGAQPLVLWRDAEGIARALEDRCPHRRAPLSLGCIRDDGWIQCGYHGWSYDGATGRLKQIPNMKGEQRFPPVYKAQAFAIAESGGFVRVCLDPAAAAPAPEVSTMALSGTAHVAIEQAAWIAALYDDPALLIDIRGVRFTPYLMSELREEGGLLVMERSCQWAGLHWPAPFSADFPITVLTRSDPATGRTELPLRDDQFTTLLTAVIAPVPAARGVTAVRWRAEVGRGSGLHGRLLGLGTPFAVREAIDAAALRRSKPSASTHYDDLRARLATSSTPGATAELSRTPVAA
ncbi:Rieske (2Fe-2S) protein [Sphingomonas solaris]|uniref:Rieske (2Fe-2S) protein n=1 Tax=Alterirhizorhabdus solaris TaxID=2529389 RepID=A0A558RD37_9SPHN|nr:Rieske (2Fe-2S) protein [Sphingomonas solaris]TVV77142.1 Rieske (2Fe-2S) protein [Sphingomonas solaris]